MIRIDRVVTRGGDGGETSLGDGARVPKDALRWPASKTTCSTWAPTFACRALPASACA